MTQMRINCLKLETHMLFGLLELHLLDVSFISEYELQLPGTISAEGNTLDLLSMQTGCFLILPIRRNYLVSK